jgi:hypothetical protein
MRTNITLTLMVAGLLLAASPWLVGGERTIDTERNTLKIHVGKAGLFSAAVTIIGQWHYLLEAASMTVIPRK